MRTRQEPKHCAAVKGARGTGAATLPSYPFATQHASSDTTQQNVFFIIINPYPANVENTVSY